MDLGWGGQGGGVLGEEMVWGLRVRKRLGDWERGWGWVKGQRRGDGMGQEGGGGRGIMKHYTC